MKVLLHGILVAILLVGSLLILLSAPVIRVVTFLVDLPVVESLIQSGFVSDQQVVFKQILFLLLGLIGFVSNWIVSSLLSSYGSWQRRIIHSFLVAIQFAGGLFLLGNTDWERVLQRFTDSVSSKVVDVAQGGPYLALLLYGFAGYLFISLIVRPTARLSRALARHLNDDEKVLCRIQQTRWKHPITPDNLIATDQRVIVYRPTNLGFTSTIEDYNYIDIANATIERGWLFGTIFLTERFQGNDLDFRDMPKSGAERFGRTVTEQLRRHRSGVPLSQPQTMQPDAGIDEEALHILQRRLAAGEITSDQYERLLKDLKK